MKKLIAVLFSLVVVSGMMVFAEEAFVQYEVIDNAIKTPDSTNSAQGFGLPDGSIVAVYRKMQTCAPGTSKTLKVTGLKNGKCGFSFNGYNCQVPLSVAQKISSSGIKSLSSVDNSTLDKAVPVPEYLQTILQNPDYCSQNN